MMSLSALIVQALIFIFLATKLYSQADIHGLRLGMNNVEINRLIERTKWICDKYQDPLDSNGLIVLSAQDTFRSYGKARINKSAYSFEIDYTSIRMEDGVCTSIDIGGVAFTQQGVDSLQGALKAAVSQIVHSCGQPTTMYLNPRKITDSTLRKYESGIRLLIAEWKRRQYTIQITLIIGDIASGQPWIEITSASASPAVEIATPFERQPKDPSVPSKSN